jgi:NADH:ubiquinone oxidoreductase subunit E
MGSACYHHGAPEILKVIQTKLEEHRLEIGVELMGHFCLGDCGQAVVMKYADQYFKNITPETASIIFEEQILPILLHK